MPDGARSIIWILFQHASSECSRWSQRCSEIVDTLWGNSVVLVLSCPWFYRSIYQILPQVYCIRVPPQKYRHRLSSQQGAIHFQRFRNTLAAANEQKISCCCMWWWGIRYDLWWNSVAALLLLGNRWILWHTPKHLAHISAVQASWRSRRTKWWRIWLLGRRLMIRTYKIWPNNSSYSTDDGRVGRICDSTECFQNFLLGAHDDCSPVYAKVLIEY